MNTKGVDKSKMIKIISILCFFMVFVQVNAQTNTISPGNIVNFKLKITEIKNPDSVLIMWFLEPYVQDETKFQKTMFPHNPDAKGFYHQSIIFPDSMLGRSIRYRYMAAKNAPDFWRRIVLENSELQERTESWGFIDGIKGKVRPTRMLFPEPNSQAEASLLDKPYVGITTGGKPINDLFLLKKTGVSTLPVKNAITELIGSLTDEQKAISIFPIESNEWRRWHNIESWQRAGVCLEDMDTLQKHLIFNLLEASLSTQGLQKAKDIMSMEAYLARLVPEVEQLGGEKYWFTFYGNPSDTEPYGWQMEGHHLVINYFVLGDQVVMTPTFMGSEPTYIESGENEGLRTFEAEEKKGWDFYISLSSKQRQKATIFHEKEYDFNRSEAFRDNEIIATSGISAKKLSKNQQKALLDLIAEYVNNIKDGHAKIKMDEVKNHLKDTHFTWVQGDKLDGPFYYRIHSPVILIEFDHQTPVFLYDESNPNSDPVKTHIHTVVRTPNGNDYGKDLLKEHLEKDHNQGKL